MVKLCGRFLADSAHLRLPYCNSLMEICQEVSRVNIWDAVVKEKGREKDTTVEQITRSLNSFENPIAFWRKK